MKATTATLQNILNIPISGLDAFLNGFGSAWTNQSKASTAFTNQSKTATTFTNQSKASTTWTNQPQP